MTDNIKKFTPEELESLKNINIKYSTLTQRYGEVIYEQKVLQKEALAIEEEFLNLEKERDTLVSSLHEKYGNGRVDLNSGHFIPSE